MAMVNGWLPMRIRRTLARLRERILSFNRRRHDRRLLASLDDRALRDLGVDRGTVEIDSAITFWRLR